ncbi:uncharacterized protein LOC135211558 isoform X1 [Macrobrachium nipponense]|uniref:uncharacterized protein LOC135211558 isoform X1 n=1 Tax=Macrobrachium nipponense TaxID=159736 RepID=UPI0030C822C1
MVSTLLVNKISHDSTMQPILRREVALGELAYICQAGWSSLPLLQPDLQAGCDAQRAVQDLSQRLNCTSIGPVALDLRSQYQILRPYSLVSFGGVTFYYAS